MLVQELWNGYGRIERWSLASDGTSSNSFNSVIVKVVDPKDGRASHPRGWASERSNARKLTSYRVERAFYERFSPRLGSSVRVPRCLAKQETPTGGRMLLEDLDGAGFRGRRTELSEPELIACLHWLAGFHAAFVGVDPAGLWKRGTYWHLATRPDELAALQDPELRCAAPMIDARIGAARFQTLVHGDAKLANFCFSSPSASAAHPAAVAALDFQYVGGGIGVQDVGYFLGSCLDGNSLERMAQIYLDTYFESFARCLAARPGEQTPDPSAVESEWRSLWPDTWADFHRFLSGWAPDHWKLSVYSERWTRFVLNRALE